MPGNFIFSCGIRPHLQLVRRRLGGVRGLRPIRNARRGKFRRGIEKFFCARLNLRQTFLRRVFSFFGRAFQGGNFAALPAAIAGGAAYVVSKREEKNVFSASAAQSRFLKRGSERLRHGANAYGITISCRAGFSSVAIGGLAKKFFAALPHFNLRLGVASAIRIFFKELCYFRRGGLNVAVCEGFGADVANVRKGVVGFHFCRRTAWA